MNKQGFYRGKKCRLLHRNPYHDQSHHHFIIEEDNQACVYASEIPHLTRGMRHLDLAEILIKEKVESKEIKLL